jgi:hypothetical protein
VERLADIRNLAEGARGDSPKAPAAEILTTAGSQGTVIRGRDMPRVQKLKCLLVAHRVISIVLPLSGAGSASARAQMNPSQKPPSGSFAEPKLMPIRIDLSGVSRQAGEWRFVRREERYSRAGHRFCGEHWLPATV